MKSKVLCLSVISPTVNNIGEIYLVICDNEFYYYIQVIGIARYRVQQTDGGTVDISLAKNIRGSEEFPKELRHKEHCGMDLRVTNIFPYDSENENYFGFCKLIPE